MVFTMYQVFKKLENKEINRLVKLGSTTFMIQTQKAV